MMDVKLYQAVGAINEVIPNVVKIEYTNNRVIITDVFGRQWAVYNTYYEIVSTPHREDYGHVTAGY